ncbi:MAG TPA: cytochrome P450 [Rubrobacteraceae bacterium]|nr:cytochrome P450 [Rubrobacteraceae bacterium]
MIAQLLPPGPRGRSLTGNLQEYARDQLGFLARCAREYGDISRFRLINVRVYLLNHPDYIDYVLVRNNRNFIKSRRTREQLRFLGEGLLTSEGDFWRRQRRLAQPAFHKDRIAAYGRTMVEHTEAAVAGWQDGRVHDVYQEMMRLTLRIASTTLLGSDVDGQAGVIGSALDVLARRFSGPKSYLLPVPAALPTPANRRFRRAVGQLDEVVYGIIRKRREKAEETGDLLSMLLEAKDEETGERMTDKQLRDEALTILLAGHETTAIALSWTFYLLSRHPVVEGKLSMELREVLGGRVPEAQDMSRLRFTGMVVKESMRLYPPAWGIGRQAVAGCEIGGYGVPAGTQLVMSPWVMHRDPRYYEDPETFDPDRWATEAARQLPKYAYFPFGGGPRLCIGRSFAEMETLLVLAAIVQKWNLKLAEVGRIEPRPSVTLRPEKGIMMMVRRR